MKTIGKALRLVACAALVSASGVAMANNGDSSADAGSFTNVVKASKGVVIKVPINAQGEELTSAAEIRVYSGDLMIDHNGSVAIDEAFADGTPASDVPAVSEADISRDSSTWGWFGGWRGYGYGGGWVSNYYYNYRPSYYYGGSYYSYSRPYYYSSYRGYTYGGSSYYGYRSYYYPYYYY